MRRCTQVPGGRSCAVKIMDLDDPELGSSAADAERVTVALEEERIAAAVVGMCWVGADEASAVVGCATDFDRDGEMSWRCKSPSGPSLGTRAKGSGMVRARCQACRIW